MNCSGALTTSRPRNLLLACLASLCFGSTASAVVGPGQTQYNPALNPPFNFFTPSYTAGPLPPQFNIFVASHNFAYNYNGQKDGSFFGFVTSSVFANNSGQLAFTYVFNNLIPPPSALNGFNPNPPLTDIVRATINDPSNPWTGVLVSATGADGSGHSTPVPGFFGSWANGNPFDIARSVTDNGIAIEFNPLNSGTQLNSTPQDQSALVWLTTDARHFAVTNVGLSDNGHVGTAQAYGPSPVPEPSTLVLVTVGCCSGWLALRRGRSRRIAP
jgi:hypothetical protein